MSGEFAAVRREPHLKREGLNRALEQQLAEARAEHGEPDLDALLSIVSAHYDRLDAEHRGP